MRIGDKIKMSGERTRYTVQGFDERFIVATKPHFSTCYYTIIDKVERVRGPINMALGLPLDDVTEIDTPKGASDLLRFMKEEMGGWEVWGVSRRNRLDLTKSEIEQIEALA